jgi:hypothetical protein
MCYFEQEDFIRSLQEILGGSVKGTTLNLKGATLHMQGSNLVLEGTLSFKAQWFLLQAGVKYSIAR